MKEVAPWSLVSRPLAGTRGLAMHLEQGGKAPTWEDALWRLRTDPTFVEAFALALREAPFEAFLWETPPLAAATRYRRFEWVLIPSPFLATVATDDGPFAQHVRGQRGIRVFENLGGDATLVVPCAPGTDPRPTSHAHLAAFVRGAPISLVHALFADVAIAAQARIEASPAPCWVSTSGLGVFWVHVRIDEQPKYYAHAPFREGHG